MEQQVDSALFLSLLHTCSLSWSSALQAFYAQPCTFASTKLVKKVSHCRPLDLQTSLAVILFIIPHDASCAARKKMSEIKRCLKAWVRTPQTPWPSLLTTSSAWPHSHVSVRSTVLILHSPEWVPSIPWCFTCLAPSHNRCFRLDPTFTPAS